MSLLQTLETSLAQFLSTTRLYELTVGGRGDLLVEAFAADDAVQGVGTRDVIVLATDAHLDMRSLLGQPATLAISLADGSRTRFNGDVTQSAMLGSEGGFARYRLRLTPWLWRLSQVRNSCVWQDRTVMEIVDDVFGRYAPLARWRWSDEAGPFMADAALRSYCCQYRESDLAFIERLLAEEGLGWRYEHMKDGVEVVLFGDSTQSSATPPDASSAAGGGIRFHGARAIEAADTILALQAQRKPSISLATLLSYDYKAKQAVTASAPSRFSQSKLPPLESYDVPGQYAYANAAQARRYVDIRMQGREAAAQLWRGRSSVRTMVAGTRFELVDSPLQQPGDAAPAYLLLRVCSVGINNLPSPARQALAELFGPIPELLQEVTTDMSDELALTIAQAQASGYANSFDAIAADVVWRPQLRGSDGRSHPKPTAHGAQSAIVIGPDGNETAAGADEIHCDRLGRVRIRYHWQDDGSATCWVRVAQRSAGGGMGSQFLPRIGQEVLVQFLENDIDRPIIVGALFNGQGEGGVAPTSGGQPGDATDTQPFAAAGDHAPSAQGNLAGGNSPPWHGASAATAGHRNATAQWGVRTKEFGGAGYSQLLFDDTDAQGRVQLKVTSAASELNLGHLIHSADNYRGSLRGQGTELRTDAYGAVRGGAGLLISSYRIGQHAAARDPAGDNAAGIALLKQAAKLGEVFNEAASTHQAVQLAGHVGAAKAGASRLDDQAAPLPAMLKAVSGMVGNVSLDAALADVGEKQTAPGDDRLPHVVAPIVAISGQSGIAVTAGQSVQIANGELTALMSGGDSQFLGGGQMRAHSRQAIGVLGGVVKPGEAEAGLQMTAATDEIDIQAQADILKVQARDDVRVISANAGMDWAAAKSISLSTAGGANITISGGNITVQCPGKLTIRAGVKNFAGPLRGDYTLPALPATVCRPCLLAALRSGSPFVAPAAA